MPACCGGYHTITLSNDGTLHSFGHNEYGQLGLGHNTKQNVLNKIVNIPLIQTISCVNASCYLIDFK